MSQTFVFICLPEEDTWNQGYGTQALTLLIDHLFREMVLELVKTPTWTGNKRMVRCAEKVGFRSFVLMPHRIAFSVRGDALGPRIHVSAKTFERTVQLGIRTGFREVERPTIRASLGVLFEKDGM